LVRGFLIRARHVGPDRLGEATRSGYAVAAFVFASLNALTAVAYVMFKIDGVLSVDRVHPPAGLVAGVHRLDRVRRERRASSNARSACVVSDTGSSDSASTLLPVRRALTCSTVVVRPRCRAAQIRGDERYVVVPLQPAPLITLLAA
jgi:hypothetical protein